MLILVGFMGYIKYKFPKTITGNYFTKNTLKSTSSELNSIYFKFLNIKT